MVYIHSLVQELRNIILKSVIEKSKMIEKYFCSYLLNTGKAHGVPCMRSERCHLHWKAKLRIPYSECGKPTGSTSGRCPLHVKGYYVIQYVNRLRDKARCT